MDIRESALMLISNLAAEDNEISKKIIIFKSGLFPIITQNLNCNNFNDIVNECLINLISNLSAEKSWYTFLDFYGLPSLMETLLPLQKPNSPEIFNLLSAFSRIIS